MQIEIPPSEVAKLTRHAQVAGFSDVETYIASFISALAERPDAGELLPPLNEDELSKSLAMLDLGMQEFEAGGGLSVEESRHLAHEKLRAIL
jgi:hypothetical protein